MGGCGVMMAGVGFGGLPVADNPVCGCGAEIRLAGARQCLDCLRAKMCTKVPYRTMTEARAAGRKMKRAPWAKRKGVASIYWCKHHGALHITSAPPRHGEWRR